MEYDILKKFGLIIRKIREEKKLSQEQLSELSGLDRTYISSVERGKRNISLKGIYALSIALNIEISTIFQEINS